MKQDNSDNRPRVDRAWDKMNLILDQNFSKKKERRFFFLWFAGLAALFLVVFIWILNHNKALNNDNTQDLISLNKNLTTVEKNDKGSIISNEKDTIIKHNQTIESEILTPIETSIHSNKTSTTISKSNTNTDIKDQKSDDDSSKVFDTSVNRNLSLNQEKGFVAHDNTKTVNTENKYNETTTVIAQEEIRDPLVIKPTAILTMSNLPILYNLKWQEDRLLIDNEIVTTDLADQNIIVNTEESANTLWSIAAAFERAPDLEANGLSLGINKSWRMGQLSVGANVGLSYFRPAYFNNHLLVNQEEDLKVIDVQDVSNAAGGMTEDEFGAGIPEGISNIRIDKKDVFGINLGISLDYQIYQSFLFSRLGFDYLFSKPTEVFSSNVLTTTENLGFDDYINEKSILPFVELGLGHNIKPRLSLFASYKHSLKNYFELDETKLKATRFRVGLQWVI